MQERKSKWAARRGGRQPQEDRSIPPRAAIAADNLPGPGGRAGWAAPPCPGTGGGKNKVEKKRGKKIKEKQKNHKKQKMGGGEEGLK